MLKLIARILLVVTVVVFILYKLYGYVTVSQTDVPASRNDLDETVQRFDQTRKRPFEQTERESDVFKTQNTQQLHAMWNWTNSPHSPTDSVFVMIPFCKARHNANLQTKFRTCVTSMSAFSSAHIVLFIAGDAESREIADDIVSGLQKKNVEVHHIDVQGLGEGMRDTISTLQQHFSSTSDSYYTHTLFYLSTAIHRLAPPSLHRLIMLDADLKFKDDIRRLNDLFDRFLPSNVIGIAHENQPVYRHVLSMYRQSHPNTRAGSPPPEGLPGFNSGVLLLDLDRLRRSERYNTMLDTDMIQSLSKKYLYKGHLGDQDFYTLVSLENEELFFVLPCGWNRQLCRWWRDNGYKDVFDSYFACHGPISVYHGNCNTPIPDD
ncbi:xyloside xylosyltransferase 1-like [Babylonia areolata]|uniref:xyloside xylosyltransferase 1-like n=1 Tax=Babylonia areolata TaxID=304850 RepID=UPI003FCFF4C7